MRKGFLLIALAVFAGAGSMKADAQTKTGYIEVSELMYLMPEFTKADGMLKEYQQALNQQYADMVLDFNKRDSMLLSRDTIKLTRAQLELQRRDLGKTYIKLQGWNQYAQQQNAAKEETLYRPLMKQAEDAIRLVAKENGFTAVLNKSAYIVTPPESENLLPLVKKKLGIK